MTWFFLALLSACLLGVYDLTKKISLRNNAVLPVLFLNILFCNVWFIPLIVLSHFLPATMAGTFVYVPEITWMQQGYVLIKAAIVLSAWILGYIGLKHLPLTIVGPMNATRPVLVLLGALLVFGERLNVYQWIGVLLSIFSLYLLSLSGAKEGIRFKKNKWIYCIMASALLGAVSGLYDKFLMARMDRMAVQAWYNFYQLLLMGSVLMLLWWPNRKKGTPFQWRWSIPLIAVFISLADFAYFFALSHADAMISIVSMTRRSSVIISFILGVVLLKERNVKRKAFDLALILVGMLFLYLGSKVMG